MSQRNQTAAYLVLLAALSVGCYFLPDVQFDRMAYAATVATLRYDNPKTVSDLAFSVLPVSAKDSSPYISDLALNPYHLLEQEPFYSVKPVYVEAIYLLWRLGFSIGVAIHLLSVVPFFGIGVLLLVWTRRPFPAFLLMLMPLTLWLGRLDTPDGLSTLVVLAGFLTLARGRVAVAILLLTLSVWVRTDNSLVVGVLLLWLLAQRKMRLFHGAAVFVLTAVSVLTIQHFGYSWGTLLRHSFLGHTAALGEVTWHFSLRDYLAVLKMGLRSSPVDTNFAMLALLGALLWRLRKAWRPCLALIPGVLVVRYALFPMPDDRYYAWAYLLVWIGLVQVFSPRDGDERHIPLNWTEP
ncbi:MAG TPA: hypothetical protein VE825_08430 [Terriglobales bacterium]|nr:hypothetical protein [Terriglobales bacterium]